MIKQGYVNGSNKTLIGKHHKKDVFIDDNAKHIFVCGTTGSGKTITLSNFIKSGIDKDYPILIVDGKGDIGNGSMLDIVQKLNKDRKRLYIINLTDISNSYKYNPFKGTNPSIAKDMIVNMTEWSEEHYKTNAERFLQRLIQLMHLSNINISFETIVQHMTIEQFLYLSKTLTKNEIITKEKHKENISISEASGKIAENASARFSGIVESEIGTIFNQDGIDIYKALSENAIILFILNPLIYPEISPLFGRLILIDSKKAVSQLFTHYEKRIFFIFDEINVYASPTLIDLINKSRSANVTCIPATQSLADLEYASGEAFKQQVIENCNNYIVMRQNSAKSAEEWAKIIGTRNTMQVTYKISQNQNKADGTGYGSARMTREFIYHPDDIKALKTGRAYYISKDSGEMFEIDVNKPF